VCGENFFALRRPVEASNGGAGVET
jgi:hypothetical protein